MSTKTIERVVKRLAREWKNPEVWADFANEVLRGGPEVTPWFPTTAKPARVGWYERFVVVGLEFHYWTGTSWQASPRGKKKERTFMPYCWRGLRNRAEPPSLRR